MRVTKLVLVMILDFVLHSAMVLAPALGCWAYQRTAAINDRALSAAYEGHVKSIHLMECNKRAQLGMPPLPK